MKERDGSYVTVGEESPLSDEFKSSHETKKDPVVFGHAIDWGKVISVTRTTAGEMQIRLDSGDKITWPNVKDDYLEAAKREFRNFLALKYSSRYGASIYR